MVEGDKVQPLMDEGVVGGINKYFVGKLGCLLRSQQNAPIICTATGGKALSGKTSLHAKSCQPLSACSWKVASPEI